MENAAAVLGFGIAWLFFSNWACNILKIATKEKSPDTFIRVGLKFFWLLILVLAGHMFVMFWANLLKFFGYVVAG